jgi:hypothetical protein
MTALTGRLGWSDGSLSTANKESKSGRRYDDGSFHPIVNVTNVKASAETAGLTGTPLDTYLEGKEKAVIMQAIGSVFNSIELIDDTKLFERFYNSTDEPIANAGYFVGIRFRVPHGYAAQINTIELYFDQAASFDLSLYQDGKINPVWSQGVTAVAGEITEVVPTNELILNKGGFYYLGYYQEDLGAARAMDQQARWQPSRVFGYRFFEARTTSADFQRNNVGTTTKTFGLNARIVSFKDHTDSIVRNAPMFDNLLGLYMAGNIMKQIMYAVRSNGTERILKDATERFGLMYEIEGTAPIPDIPKTSGLQGRINQEVKRLRETFFPKPKAQSVSLC